METGPNENALREWMLESKLTIDLVANKWRIAIIHALSRGTLRYGQLHRALGKISHKVLTLALRSLQRDGLIERKTYKAVPPRVEYNLTPLGRSLAVLLDILRAWAREREGEIAAAQSDFDEQEKMWSYAIDRGDE